MNQLTITAFIQGGDQLFKFIFVKLPPQERRHAERSRLASEVVQIRPVNKRVFIDRMVAADLFIRVQYIKLHATKGGVLQVFSPAHQ